MRNIRHQMDTGHPGEIFKVNTANWFWDPLTHFWDYKKVENRGLCKEIYLKSSAGQEWGSVRSFLLKPKKMGIYKHGPWFALLGVGLPYIGARFTPEEAEEDCGRESGSCIWKVTMLHGSCSQTWNGWQFLADPGLRRRESKAAATLSPF